MMSRLLIGCALAAATAGAALAQDMGGSMPDPSSPKGYVMAAGQADQFEIQEGRLAEARGKTEAIRHFGAKMVKDHTKSTNMVLRAAMKSGLPSMPPPELRPDQKQMLEQLRSTSGADFDRTYVQQQMQAHQQALQLQQNYAQNGTDPALKHAASEIVPVVQEHISMLQSMPGAGG